MQVPSWRKKRCEQNVHYKSSKQVVGRLSIHVLVKFEAENVYTSINFRPSMSLTYRPIETIGRSMLRIYMYSYQIHPWNEVKVQCIYLLFPVVKLSLQRQVTWSHCLCKPESSCWLTFTQAKLQHGGKYVSIAAFDSQQQEEMRGS